MDRPESQREGFALAAAIMALVVVGALVTGGFYAATQEGRVTRSTAFGAEALQFAEFGIDRVLGEWNIADYDAIVGSSTTLSDNVDLGGKQGVYEVTVRSLGGRLFAIRSTGEVTGRGLHNGASRTLALVVRTNNMQVLQDRAVQVYGAIEVGGNSRVDGTDIVPTTWENHGECSDLGTKAGVVAREDSLVTTKGSGSIEGDPAVREDATMDSASFTKFGDFDYDELVALASKIVPAGTTVNNTAPTTWENGACKTIDEYNWGAPLDSTSSCHYYFPIIHAEGNLRINSSASGQGILLVDGDLHIQGGYQFYGVMIIKGRFTTGNGEARINGTTIIFGDGDIGTESTVNGTPIVSFSSCSIDRAVRYNSDIGRAVPIAGRSWIDLSAIGGGD